MNPRMAPWRQESGRRRPALQRKKSFCIFTEGMTEKLYFEDFNLPTLRVKCVGLGGGNAEHLLQDALCQMRQPKYSGFDYYYLVFDCDANSQEEISRVLEMARRRQMRWCFSNPCFEIWYLLHFVFRDTPVTPIELKRRLLPQRIPGYTETMPGLRELLKEKTALALQNALRLLPMENRAVWEKNLRQANPSTNVDDLVRLLME